VKQSYYSDAQKQAVINELNTAASSADPDKFLARFPKNTANIIMGATDSSTIDAIIKSLISSLNYDSHVYPRMNKTTLKNNKAGIKKRLVDAGFNAINVGWSGLGIPK
jgi:hypothetical protein